MDRKKLLKHLVALMFFMFMVDSMAKYFYWYSLIWYFDMIMHFLGGFWVGLFFIYIFYDEGSFWRNVFIIISCVLFIGILWEFFEFFLNTVSLTSFDPIDTLSDIFFDLLGGLCAILYVWKKLPR